MKLNERQLELYAFLLRVSKYYPGRYLSKEVIVKVLNRYYPRYLEHSSEHNSRAFSMLRKDVRTINFSDVEKIIVSSKKGYKIATKEEAIKYVKRKLASNLKGLKLYWNIKHKIDHDGQFDINLHEVSTFIDCTSENVKKFGEAAKKLTEDVKEKINNG